MLVLPPLSLQLVLSDTTLFGAALFYPFVESSPAGKNSTHIMGNLPSSARNQADDLISHTLSSNPVVIFSKTSCPYCKTAANTLSIERHRLSRGGCSVPRAKVISLDELPTKVANQMQDIFFETTGARTVPRVFVEGQCIGGAEDLVRYQQTGGLEMALRKLSKCPREPRRS